jgi:hypothetical protein
VTPSRPVIDEDLVPEVRTWADRYGKEVGIRISFNAAVNILIRRGLDTTIKGDGTDENDTS